MFERFTKSVSKVAAVVSGKEIFSEQGKEKLRELSQQIGQEIGALEQALALQVSNKGEALSSISSSSDDDSKGKGKEKESVAISADIVVAEAQKKNAQILLAQQREALQILQKVKALLDKLVGLNSWQLIALGSLEPAEIEPRYQLVFREGVVEKVELGKIYINKIARTFHLVGLDGKPKTGYFPPELYLDRSSADRAFYSDVLDFTSSQGYTPPEKAIADLTLEELVQDLLLNRDIYWDIKNKLLHQSLASLFKTLAKLENNDFSEAGEGVLVTIGGVEKIHAVGTILSSLLPFYAITKSEPGVSNEKYHPYVDRKLLDNFKGELIRLHDDFLAAYKAAQSLDEKRALLDNYKKDYQAKLIPFLGYVDTLPGEDIFLETNNTAFRPDSIMLFRPQGGVLRGLLDFERVLNLELRSHCSELEDKTLPLRAVYDRITTGLFQENIHKKREQLFFGVITPQVINAFQSYILENEHETGLTKQKVDLLQDFLNKVIANTQTEHFVNKDGNWRTADSYQNKGQLYTCMELATHLLVQLIDLLKRHDEKCKKANRGVGRTGLLLAEAIATTAEYLEIPYNRSLDDTFLGGLSTYKEALSVHFNLTSELAASSSSSSASASTSTDPEQQPSRSFGM